MPSSTFGIGILLEFIVDNMPVICPTCHDANGTCACPPSAKRVAVAAGGPLPAAPSSGSDGLADGITEKLDLVTTSMQQTLELITSVRSDIAAVAGRTTVLETRADTTDGRLDAAEQQIATLLRDMQSIHVRSRGVERTIEHLS